MNSSYSALGETWPLCKKEFLSWLLEGEKKIANDDMNKDVHVFL